MPAANSMTVLVVDDQNTMRGYVMNCLRQLGITNVTSARDGTDALRKMMGLRFDLVISDWVMEDMQGIDLLKQVRKHPVLRKTPFIMASTQSDHDLIETVVAAGVDNYLIKSFEIDQLEASIEAVVGSLE